MVTDFRSLPGAVLSCFGKKVPQEADQRGHPISRSRRRSPLETPRPFLAGAVQCFGFVSGKPDTPKTFPWGKVAARRADG